MRSDGRDHALHADRARALSFGSVAEMYERSRPGYPRALVDELMAGRPRRVLDVGCGTGKAGRLLLERGCDVLGVEPDPRMAEVARTRGMTVEVASFEAWEPRARTFDLLVCAQAWHWVDPTVGPAKAAALLEPGGRLALFWNLLAHERRARRSLAPVYARIAPEIAGTTTALGRYSDSSRHGELVSGPSGFAAADVRRFDWETEYSRDGWLEYLSTCSDHIGLASGTRVKLFEALSTVIDSQFGGKLRVRYRTRFVIARRAH